MINKNNDLPSFVNETNLPKIVDKLTDAKNIKISNNKYGNRVQTVIDKIVEKADDITKAIKQEVVNNSYSFKVGTGDVDVSADVEDGFGEVGVKGVTYQNIVKSYEATNFSLLNATIEQGYFKIKHAENVNSSFVRVKVGTHLYKPNTKYTVIVDIKENTCDKNLGMSAISSCVSNLNPKNFINKTGISMSVITTRADISVDDKGNKPILDLYFGIWEEGGDLSNHITFRYWILEGDHTNTPNLPQYFEGIVGVGDKSKNLLNPNSFKSSTGISMIENQVINIDVPIDGGQRTIFEGLNLPAGTYRVTTKVLEGEYTGGNLLFYDSNGKKFTENRLIGSYTINATNNNINKLSIWAVKGICKIRIQLEKGSSKTPYEPYYDGHKIEILSNSKNIVDYNNYELLSASAVNKPVNTGGAWKLYNNIYRGYGWGFYVTVKEDTNYTLCNIDFDYVGGQSGGYIYIAQVGEDGKGKSFIKQIYDLINLTFNSGKSRRIFIELGMNSSNVELNSKSTYILLRKLQLVEGDVETPFQEYQQDKTQILLDEPLMRLPNGICDEITKDGKLIRRIGKHTFTGNEYWSIYSNVVFDNSLCFCRKIDDFRFSKNETSISRILCDKAPRIQSGYGVDGFSISTYDNYVYLRLTRTMMNSFDKDGFLSWLSQNPITIYYELTTPVITDIIPPSLRIFKDGHLTFNTLVAPESNHVVQLNKSAQIQNAIKESQSLDNRINVLENNYDNLMLSTISRLNDLELDYTLK